MKDQLDLLPSDGNSGANFAEDGEFLPNWLRRSHAFIRRCLFLILSFMVIGALLAVIAASSGPLKYRSLVSVYFADTEGRSPRKLSPYVEIDFEEYELSLEVLRAVIDGENISQFPEFQSEPVSWLGTQLSAVKEKAFEIRAMISGEDFSPAQASVSGPAPTEAQLIQRVREATNVSLQGKGSVIEISVTANSPESAHRLTSAVGDAFIEARNRQQKTRIAEEVRLHSERVVHLHNQVVAAEKALADYVERYDLENLETRFAQIELQTANLNFEILRLQAKDASLRDARDRIEKTVSEKQDLGSVPDVQASELAGRLQKARLELERRFSDLQQQNAPGSQLDEVTTQLAEVDRQLLEEALRIVARLDNEISTIATRENRLQDELSELLAETEAIDTALRGIDSLQRDVDARREIYVGFLSEDDPNYDYETQFEPDAWVLQPASRPTEPISRPIVAITISGSLAGAALGMLLGLFRERMIRGFVAAGQIEQALRLPVLLSLPRPEARKWLWPRKSAAKRRRQQLRIAEELRSFRHWLTDNFGAGQAAIVHLASVRRKEGRIDFITTLANAAMEDRRSVLLIDADLEAADLSKGMNCEYADGLTELVEEAHWDLEGIAPGTGEFQFLPAGCMIDKPLRFIESPAFARFLDDARKHFDLILINGPSNVRSVETRVLATLCDASCLIVRWNFTPRDVISDAVEGLDRDKVVGVVFTEVDTRKSAAYRATYPSNRNLSAAHRVGRAKRPALPRDVPAPKASGGA